MSTKRDHLESLMWRGDTSAPSLTSVPACGTICEQATGMADKKRIERAYLEMAQAIDADFPCGAPVEGESPDFVFVASDGRLGVEITRLFQVPAGAPFPPRAVEGFRERVVRRAEQLYKEQKAATADVTVYFSPRSAIKQKPDELAGAVAEFATKNFPRSGSVAHFTRGLPTTVLPPGIESITIAVPLAGRQAQWFARGVGETLLLGYEQLARTIADKNSLLPRYRARVDTAWLLVVTDIFPSSASFAVPGDIDAWTFPFAFDRVLLLSREEQRIWSLKRAAMAIEAPPDARIGAHA
jgi:hypothetical protein